MIKAKPYTLDEALAVAPETRCLRVGRGIVGAAPDLFREHVGQGPALVVGDVNTFPAAGHAVMEAFQAAGLPVLEPFIFRERDLHADVVYSEQLESALRGNTACLVAVGSGCLNDICKYASHLVQRRYMCVATAASMDGYTSYGAAMTLKGGKQTLVCPAPVAVLADVDIIRAAPGEMNSWGYADLLAKVPAGADWILADALGTEPIHQMGWDIVQGRLRELLDDPVGVRNRAPDAIGKLIEALLMGGFAMQVSRSTRAASGAEHLFSHTWEMQNHTHNGQMPSHGFKVAVGTMAASALYESLLRKPIEQLDVEACCATWPDLQSLMDRARTLFDGHPAIMEIVNRELSVKYCDRAQLAVQLSLVKRIWPELRNQLREQLPPMETLRHMLVQAGAPTAPEHIGITRERLRRTYWQASFIRRRITVLDLALRTGFLEDCLDEIFGAGGVWPSGAK